MSQIGSLLNNALKFEKIPDEKLKIYNQALAKLKELQENNENPNNMKNIMADFLQYNDQYEVDNKTTESKQEKETRIANEISEIKKSLVLADSAKNIKDYSNQKYLKTKNLKQKEAIDFINLTQVLDTLGTSIADSNTTLTELKDFINYYNYSINNTLRKLLANSAQETKDYFDKNLVSFNKNKSNLNTDRDDEQLSMTNK